MKYVSFIVVMLLCCFTMNAQEVTAGIYGTMQDSTAAIVPNATVTLHNVETGRDYTTKSDQSGNFLLTRIPVGSYEVYAEATGFQRAVVSGVTLAVNENRRIDFKLQVGAVTNSITVSGDYVTVNTASGTTSSVIGSTDLENLPSSGRSVASYALLMPGAVSTAPTSETSTSTSVNGIRPTHNAWMLDGAYTIDTGGNWNIMVPADPEIVGEVRLIRSNYSAEFGIGGGSQFNVVTKQGTNTIHGSAYEYLQNANLNARSYFQTVLPVMKQHDYGFTLGGPIYIPKVYDGRNKTFFFVHVNKRPNRRETEFKQKVPFEAYRTGNFSGLGKVITNPVTGLPFDGNQIPIASMDANARLYAAQYPATNFTDTLGNTWRKVQPNKTDTFQFTIRGDHNFSEKHRVGVRLTKGGTTSTYQDSQGFDQFVRKNLNYNNNTTVTFTSSIRPNLLNEASFARTHLRLEYFPTGITHASGISIPLVFPVNKNTYPLANLNLTEIPDIVPTISAITNYAGIAPSTPWSNFQSTFDWKDNVIWIKSAHTIKFGVDIPLDKKFEPTNTNVFGDFTFDGKVTGDAFADFLLGKAASFTQTNNVAFNDNRRLAFEAYVADSWKVSQRLMLDLGVRYSLFPPAHEAQHQYRVFDPQSYSQAKAVTVDSNGYIVANSGDIYNGIVNPEGMWKYSKHNFAPRVSFAYDLFGDGKMAIRGGAGMFYSREILGAFILMSGNPPYSKLVSIYNTSLSNPSAGNPLGYDLPLTIGSYDLKHMTPYTSQWNLSIQRVLSTNFMVEIGYSGTRGIHLMRTRDVNQGLPNIGVANKTVNANQVRPYKGFGVVSNREQSYESKYHGLSVELSRRFAAGLMFKVDYTWSKALDNTDCCSGDIYNWYPNSNDASLEWGRSSFDSQHHVIASWVYDLPLLRNRKDLAGKIGGGWQLSGIFTVMTGIPYDPVIGVDQAGIGSTSMQRPQILSTPKAFIGFGERTVDKWFETAAFGTPPIGTFATTSRNFLSMPGTNNWNLALHKMFRMTERVGLQFRGEFNNAFNHTQFSNLGYNRATTSTWGKITAATNARNLLLGLRLEW